MARTIPGLNEAFLNLEKSARNSFLHKIQWHSQKIMDHILDWLSLVNTCILSFSKIILKLSPTHVQAPDVTIE
jgi:hypothetical protein